MAYAVDKAITARVTAAQQLGELPVIQKTISQAVSRKIYVNDELHLELQAGFASCMVMEMTFLLM